MNKALPYPIWDKDKSISRNAFIYLYVYLFDNGEGNDTLDALDEALEHVGMAPLVHSDRDDCPAFDWIVQEILLSVANGDMANDVLEAVLMGEIQYDDEEHI
jgi:hypothetical protein